LGESVVASLPSAVVGGQKARAKVTVVLTNQSAQLVSGPVSLSLYVSGDEALGTGDAPVAQATKNLKLKPGRSKKVRMRVASFPAVTDGSYRLLAQVVAPDGTANLAAAPSAVTIAAPFVDLRGSFASGVAGALKPGGKGKAVLRVENLGNIPAKGLASVSLYASTDAAVGGPDDRLLATLPLKVNVKPGKAKGYRLKVGLPVDLAAGSYFLIGSVDGTAVADRDVSNNVAISPGPFGVA
jgi:hypothetical protein